MPERRRGQSRTLRELAIQAGMTADVFDALTPKERRRLHTELTAGTGNGKSYTSGKRDGEPTQGRHGVGQRRTQRGKRR